MTPGDPLNIGQVAAVATILICAWLLDFIKRIWK